MNGTPQNSKIVSVAMLTICVDPETTEQILQSTDTTQWVVIPADFEVYISSVRRPHLGQQIKISQACIAIVDFDKDLDQAVETTRYLQQTFGSKITIVALSENTNPNLLLLAMRAGCSEFLNKPFDEDAFQLTLRRLDQQWSEAEMPATKLGSVLSFFGAKGGVGSTTLAVHLAMYLVQCHQKKTLLIDNHPQLGHACVYMGLDGSQYHFHEVVRNVDRLDSDLLRGFIAKHSSGLEVLSSPDVCGDARVMDAESVLKTIEFLRGEYDYIVIDNATSLDDVNLAVIDASTQLYLIATPEVAAIRDLSRYVDRLMQINLTTEKMHVVINRFTSRYAVNIEQIERGIHLPVAIKLPNSYMDLVRSVNLGEPIEPSRKTEFSTQFTRWVNSITGTDSIAIEQDAPKRSRFAVWK